MKTMPAKTSQLQIRVTPEQKRAIQRAAREKGSDVSAFILGEVLAQQENEFRRLTRRLSRSEDSSFPLAELNDFLTALTPREFFAAVRRPPGPGLTPLLANLVAAMVEYAACQKRCSPPVWVRAIEPLQEPFFASALVSLRLYLLKRSPPAFRRRNLFVDASTGSRV